MARGRETGSEGGGMRVGTVAAMRDISAMAAAAAAGRSSRSGENADSTMNASGAWSSLQSHWRPHMVSSGCTGTGSTKQREVAEAKREQGRPLTLAGDTYSRSDVAGRNREPWSEGAEVGPEEQKDALKTLLTSSRTKRCGCGAQEKIWVSVDSPYWVRRAAELLEESEYMVLL
jgi:hypothetical protein